MRWGEDLGFWKRWDAADKAYHALERAWIDDDATDGFAAMKLLRAALDGWRDDLEADIDIVREITERHPK